MLASRFGTLLLIDEDTTSKKNLQRARVLIKTPLPVISNAGLEVAIDGKIHKIKITEEVECPLFASLFDKLVKI